MIKRIHTFFTWDLPYIPTRVKSYLSFRKYCKKKGIKLDKAEMTKCAVKAVFKHFATARVLAIYRTVPNGTWQVEYKFRGSELGKEYAYVDDKTGKVFFNIHALEDFLEEEGRLCTL